MAVEIERKFLVPGDWPREAAGPGIPIVQGYLVAARDRSVRVRLAGERALLTIKGLQRGRARAEFEYPVPVGDARDMLATLCADGRVEKIRYAVDHGGREWVVDVFGEANAGLVVAEIELDAPDESIDLPGWLGREVSDDPRYLNANLAKEPFRNWSESRD